MSEKEKPEEQNDPEVMKKISDDHTKKQDSRMMTFFNQEFIERKIDFKPK
jgi:hypothetical protein